MLWFLRSSLVILSFVVRRDMGSVDPFAGAERNLAAPRYSLPTRASVGR